MRTCPSRSSSSRRSHPLIASHLSVSLLIVRVKSKIVHWLVCLRNTCLFTLFMGPLSPKRVYTLLALLPLREKVTAQKVPDMSLLTPLKCMVEPRRSLSNQYNDHDIQRLLNYQYRLLLAPLFGALERLLRPRLRNLQLLTFILYLNVIDR